MMLSVRQSSSATGATIYWPADKPLLGGVVCLRGSEGGFAGWNDLNCALLAANGFVAMAQNYTRNAHYLTQPDIDDVPLEGTETALLCLRKQLPAYDCGIGLSVARVGRSTLCLRPGCSPRRPARPSPMRSPSTRRPMLPGQPSSSPISRPGSDGQAMRTALRGLGVAGMSGPVRECHWKLRVFPIRCSSLKGQRTMFGGTIWHESWVPA